MGYGYIRTQCQWGRHKKLRMSGAAVTSRNGLSLFMTYLYRCHDGIYIRIPLCLQ